MLKTFRKLIAIIFIVDIAAALVMLLLVGFVKHQLSSDENLNVENYPVPVVAFEDNGYFEYGKVCEQKQTIADWGSFHNGVSEARASFARCEFIEKSLWKTSIDASSLDKYEQLMPAIEKLICKKYHIHPESHEPYAAQSITQEFSDILLFLRARAMLAALENNEDKAVASLIAVSKILNARVNNPNPIYSLRNYSYERDKLLADTQKVCLLLGENLHTEKFAELLQPPAQASREAMLYPIVISKLNEVRNRSLFYRQDDSGELKHGQTALGFLIPAIPLLKQLRAYYQIKEMCEYVSNFEKNFQEQWAEPVKWFAWENASRASDFARGYVSLASEFEKREIRTTRLLVCCLAVHEYFNAHGNFPENTSVLEQMVGKESITDPALATPFVLRANGPIMGIYAQEYNPELGSYLQHDELYLLIRRYSNTSSVKEMK